MFGYGAKMHQCVNIFILGNFSAENQQPAYKIAGKGAIRYYFHSIKRLALLTNPTESADFHYDLPPISCFYIKKFDRISITAYSNPSLKK